MTKAFLIVLCYASSSYCFGQQPYISQSTLPTKYRIVTLVDATTGNKFVLDSARILVTALNKQGQQLWRTDAWKDNHLDSYRVKRPVISYFVFEKSEMTEGKEAIWIIYNNTQFGFLDKKTGAFTWLGQD